MSVSDMVNHAITGDPLEFEKAFDAVMAAKVADAREVARQNVATAFGDVPADDTGTKEEQNDDQSS